MFYKFYTCKEKIFYYKEMNVMSGFSKNWVYEETTVDNVPAQRRAVKAIEGHPHYRNQADIKLIEVAKEDRDSPKFRKFNVVAGSVSNYAETAYPELATLEAVGDVNHFQEKYPDLVIFRINNNGEGRIMGGEKISTDPEVSARFPDHRK